VARDRSTRRITSFACARRVRSERTLRSVLEEIMNKVIAWIRRFWEQRKALEPSPHPDTGKNELARVRALLCLGLAACGTAEARSYDASVDAEVIEAGPLEPAEEKQSPAEEAPLERPWRKPTKLPVTPGPEPLVAPLAIGPDLPSSVRRF